MKHIKILKWVGTALFITAGMLVSSNVDESKYAFFLFLSGHAIYIYVFSREWDSAMLANNAFFVIVDIWGIYRWVTI